MPAAGLVRNLARSLGAAAAGAGIYGLVVRGGLTLDVGVGRRVRPLGPLVVVIDAPRDLVFDLIASPYLGHAGREAAKKIEVLERGSDMVVAAHHTPAGGIDAVTIESVRFDRPERVSFRLLRGPVPHVVEAFELEEIDGKTRLTYAGELGTDLWAIGAAWGSAVANKWVRTVDESLADIRQRSEHKAAAQRRRGKAAPG